MVKRLGQNFLVDRNILDVIERLAELCSDDVVLEIGGGEGVLSSRLAGEVSHLHVVEVDRRLEPRLRAAVGGFSNVSLYFADALDLDLAGLHPPPSAVVANLPYSIAATVILRTIDELPSVLRWVVMVQREVGERLAASVGESAYGAPSVLAQLACEVRVLRPISRTVFRPVPRVDSVLVGLRRRVTSEAGAVAVDPAVRALVHDAFAHRRKALAGSLALAPGAPAGIRERARDALVSLGHPPDERAERLSPEEFVELAARLGGRGIPPRHMREASSVEPDSRGIRSQHMRKTSPVGPDFKEIRSQHMRKTSPVGPDFPVRLVARAPGKVNLCLFLGPVRGDGRHELVTLFESVSVADEVTVAVGAGADHVVCPGVDGLNIVAQTLDGLRARGWDGPPVRVTIEKRIPVAGGMAGGSADAAAVLRMAPLLAPVADGVVEEVAAQLGADVPSQLVPGVAIGTGAGEVVERLVEPLAPHAFVVVPQGFELATAEVYREADRLGLPRDVDELAGFVDALHAAGDELPAELLVNDLAPAAVSLAPEIGAALDAVREAGAAEAIVSGSGPTVLGVFFGPEAGALAAAAAGDLADRYPGATAATPVSEEFGAPRGS